MGKIDKIDKQIAWWQKQTDPPLIAHMISSLLIFWFVGFIMLLVDSEIIISQMSGDDIADQLVEWTSVGLIFGIANRWYAKYQLKRLRKKKAELSSQND